MTLRLCQTAAVLSEDDPERRLTIMVAEDSPAVRRVIKEGLTLRGYDVQAASNGEQALEMARLIRPDAVILDWVMPGMPGIKVCEELKTNRETSHIPIIMLTGKTFGREIEMGFEHGADEYLTKPFDLEELEITLRRLLRRNDT